MKYDKILVVDVEATCWKEYSPENINEIIEIGISTIDTKSKKIIESRSIIVKPEHSKVSEFCTELTTLTQKDVDSGISFKSACDIIVNEYNSKLYTWGSYGFYDKNQFEKQCKRENIEYPFSNAYINVKLLFALKYSMRKDVGMAKALKIMKIPLIGTHHRGVDDSKNIATILSKILFNK